MAQRLRVNAQEFRPMTFAPAGEPELCEAPGQAGIAPWSRQVFGLVDLRPCGLTYCSPLPGLSRPVRLAKVVSTHRCGAAPELAKAVPASLSIPSLYWDKAMDTATAQTIGRACQQVK